MANFAPIAGVIPAQATALALVLVGFYMMSVVREIAWDEYDQAVPALVTMLVMPFRKGGARKSPSLRANP